MQRKLIRVGTSAAIIIPKVKLEELNVDIGDTVYLDISTKAKNEQVLVDPAVVQWTDEFIQEYKPMLKKLASS